MNNDNNEALAPMRHSLAHLLAAAVLEIYPDAKLTLGPATNNGFYYDIDFGDTPVNEKDLKAIQKGMRKLLNKWSTFEHKEVSADEARDFYKGNEYKLELIEEIIKRGEKITLYTNNDFTDLCRGGHVEDMSTIDANSFQLDRLAGAYWRGDEKNKMLTRIYGLAFENKEKLDEYLELREEAKKRDHRKLGAELDLFTFSDLVGPGLPLFTPKGAKLRDLIVGKVEAIQKKYNYQRVCTPHITKQNLYETSGHWDKFGDELFKVTGKGDTRFVMKPMNCPHHTQIFAAKMRSYRDLPIRLNELGVTYRDEQVGELLGLARVRAISMDDAHIFCRPDQIKQEFKNVIDIVRDFYTALGMWGDKSLYWVSLSARDPETPEKYLGDKELWDKAETILAEIADEEDLVWKKVEGEAAFYGPKLDFQFYDALGRERQLATVQLDFNMPSRFELEYTDSDGEKKAPVMIHRAISGSLERFLSVIIEHFAGHFPLWLSPVQVAVLPISTDKHDDYSREVVRKLDNAGVRVEYHDASESLGKRIRTAKLQKIPYLIIIGDSEMEGNVITVEGRNDVKLENISVGDFINRIHTEITENK